MANDGGSYNTEPDAFDSVVFAPADPTDSIKKRKKEKKTQRADARASPKHSLESRQSISIVNTSKQSGGAATSRHKNKSSHPGIPRSRARKVDTHLEDDICYAEWWMSCFPDAFKEMMPKR